MSNVERLEYAFGLWNRRDIDGVLEMVAPEVIWRPAPIMPDLDEVYEGREGVRRFFRAFMEPWEEISMETAEAEAIGDEVVTRSHFRARGREGMQVDVEFGQRYAFRPDDGLLIRFSGYASYEEALEAARAGA